MLDFLQQCEHVSQKKGKYIFIFSSSALGQLLLQYKVIIDICFIKKKTIVYML